mmetsp:Transcript_57528/g.178595  ORF Transcript_57528/g.178595 Transcript_57528/m.178595 type:complete len:257 (-) Transcript_57528:2156-2926(-)
MVEVARRPEDGPGKDDGRPDDPEERRYDAYGHHSPPVLVVAQVAAVLTERQLAVRIVIAFEYDEGGACDPCEEGEHQGQTRAHHKVQVHGQLLAPPSERPRRAPDKRVQGDAHGGQASLQDQLLLEARDAGALRGEEGQPIAHELKVAERGPRRLREGHVRAADDVDDVVLVQDDEDEGRKAVPPAPPPRVGVAGQEVEQADEEGREHQRQNGEDEEAGGSGPAIDALLPRPMAALLALRAGPGVERERARPARHP